MWREPVAVAHWFVRTFRNFYWKSVESKQTKWFMWTLWVLTALRTCVCVCVCAHVQTTHGRKKCKCHSFECLPGKNALHFACNPSKSNDIRFFFLVFIFNLHIFIWLITFNIQYIQANLWNLEKYIFVYYYVS